MSSTASTHRRKKTGIYFNRLIVFWGGGKEHCVGWGVQIPQREGNVYPFIVK